MDGNTPSAMVKIKGNVKCNFNHMLLWLVGPYTPLHSKLCEESLSFSLTMEESSRDRQIKGILLSFLVF